MKVFICVFLIFGIILSCSSPRYIGSEVRIDSLYMIKKVQTKNSWYIIYAVKGDSLYKIISGKEKLGRGDCNKISVGNYYALELKSRRENIPVINGIKLKPVNHLDVRGHVYDKDGAECYSFDSKTEICTEPSNGIYDLYYTGNLKGLCYLK